MEEVYEANKERMEIIALSADPDDTMQIMADYKESHSLTFPVGLTENNLSDLTISGFPTTIIIDRNGKVGFIKVGSFETKQDFEDKVNYFLSSDYDGKPLETEKAVSIVGPLIIYFIVSNLLLAAGRWFMFRKAGSPAWHSLIPILSTVKEYELCWRGWIGAIEAIISVSPFVLALIPALDFLGPLVTWGPVIATFALRAAESMKLAAAFGKGKGYGIFLTFLRPIGRIFLGLGKAEYKENFIVEQ